VIPWSEPVLALLPTFLQVLALRALLNSRCGEVGLEWHVFQAPDEIHELAMQLQALVDQPGTLAPAVCKVLWARGGS
jgi:hypothetical protein